MEETIFQKIIRREIPADIVYETDAVLAFLDINPVNKGHTLVIPKKPMRDIHELPDSEAKHLMEAIIRVANAVKKVTGAPGINVTANNGAEAGQEVPHLHFHIIPRFSKDEFQPVPHTAYENDEEKKRFSTDIAATI